MVLFYALVSNRGRLRRPLSGRNQRQGLALGGKTIKKAPMVYFNGRRPQGGNGKGSSLGARTPSFLNRVAVGPSQIIGIKWLGR